jgi:hypothetical protein
MRVAKLCQSKLNVSAQQNYANKLELQNYAKIN